MKTGNQHLWTISFLPAIFLILFSGFAQEDDPLPNRGWLSGGLAWSPDSTMLAVGSSLGVWIYATDNWEDVLFRGDQIYINSLAWSPNGWQIASASGETIDLWDSATGETLMTLEGHTNTVSVVRWSPDGTLLASGSWDNTVRLWDVNSGITVHVLKGWEALDSLDSIAWSLDGSRIAINGLTLTVWDAKTGEQLQAWSSDKTVTTTVRWLSDDEQLVVGTSNGDIEIRDVASGELITHINAHPRTVRTIDQSPRNWQLASIGGNEFAFEGSSRQVKVWDTTTGKLVIELEKGITTGDATFYEYALAWSPDGRWLASASDEGMLHVWDTTTWDLVRVDDRYYSLIHTNNYRLPTPIITVTPNSD